MPQAATVVSSAERTATGNELAKLRAVLFDIRRAVPPALLTDERLVYELYHRDVLVIQTF